ncbi:MAG: DUF1570 domain-containing protein [Planctomycetota bacterium]
MRNAPQQNTVIRACLTLLAVTVLASPAPGQSRGPRLPWWDRAQQERVGAYVIKTDLPAADANALAKHLNRMYLEYSRRLASLPERTPEKLNVMIFSTRREYVDVLRNRFGVNAMNTGGIFFVNPQGSALALWTEGLHRRRINHVIQHEGFHQFAYSRFGNDLPIWVNEGMAEFFGESILVGDRLILGQSTPRLVDRVRDAIENGESIGFERMLTMDSERWGSALRDGTAALQYAQAWSMVHFLVYGSNGRYQGAFEQYLRLLNQGVRSAEAFSRAFGTGPSRSVLMARFEQRWKDYARASVPSAFATAMERMEFLAEGALALSEREIVPTTLDELQEELGKIRFVHALDRHGRQVALRYDDPAMYVIPKDDLAIDQPTVEVEAANILRLSRRLRRLEDIQRTPPTIRSVDLEPREVEVRWIRNDDHSFRYDIVVR